ncbi:hypothetical protein CR513_52766, partial [Mucuna pruriens]
MKFGVNNESSTSNLLNDLTSRLTQMPTHDSFIAQIDIKIDSTNYALWSQVVEIKISLYQQRHFNTRTYKPFSLMMGDRKFNRQRMANLLHETWID